MIGTKDLDIDTKCDNCGKITPHSGILVSEDFPEKYILDVDCSMCGNSKTRTITPEPICAVPSNYFKR